MIEIPLVHGRPQGPPLRKRTLPLKKPPPLGEVPGEARRKGFNRRAAARAAPTQQRTLPLQKPPPSGEAPGEARRRG